MFLTFVCVCSGVLMWEVFSEGRMPFEQSQNHEVVTLVTKGHRLFRPKMAPPAVYDIMQLCWHEVSHDSDSSAAKRHVHSSFHGLCFCFRDPMSDRPFPVSA